MGESGERGQPCNGKRRGGFKVTGAGMDRTIPKSKARLIKRIAIVAAIAVALVGGGVRLASIDFKSHRVDRQKLSIDTVQQGTMEIKVSANGQLLSKNIEQLVAQVSGRVAKREVQPGALVRVGQVLMELSNPQLVTSAEEAQSAWEGAVAELQSSEAELQYNMLNQEVVLTQAKVNLEKAQLTLETDRLLDRDKLVSAVELKRAQFDVNQLEKTYALEETRLQKLRDNIQVQLAVKKSRVAQLERALERAKTQAA